MGENSDQSGDRYIVSGGNGFWKYLTEYQDQKGHNAGGDSHGIASHQV